MSLLRTAAAALCPRCLAFKASRLQAQHPRRYNFSSVPGVQLHHRHSPRPFVQLQLVQPYSNASNFNIFESDGTTLAPPPSGINFFHLFGLQETFDVDHRALQNEFRRLQATFHPDKFAAYPEPQLERAEDWSSLANRAYSRLSRPLERALYLLELRGRALEEKESATDVEFLSEVMEANEELSEVSSPASLAAFSARNRLALSKIVEEVREAFAAGDIDAAREATVRMRYYSNLQDKVVEKELEMGVVK